MKNLYMPEMVETDYYKIWIADNIVHVLYKEGSMIGLKTAKELVEARLNLQKGKSYNGIAYLNNVALLNKETKEYLAIAGYKGVIKVALIAKSPISILVGNLFILVNKPPKPTKLFKNKEDAIKWLIGNN
jgi:hypothetical protein